MKKKMLMFIFTFLLFIGATQYVEAAKTQYKCNYSNGTIKAEFRLRLGVDGLTVTEDALISGSGVSSAGKYNNESVLNWSNALKGTSFIGKNYYATNKNCPPYAYFFEGEDKGWLSWATSKTYQFYVSDEAAGGDFESKIKDKYNIKGQIYVLDSTGVVEEIEPAKLPTSCMDFGKNGNSSAEELADKYPCENNPYFACVWNETNANPDGGYCNTDSLQYVKCGDAFDIPKDMPRIISFVVNLLKIGTPIILIIISIITLLKALVASNEDEIKKAQKSLIQKIIAAVMVFFVISIVQFVIMKVADSSETKSMSKCLTCFLNNDCEDNIYYKTNVGGEYICTGINGDNMTCGEEDAQ